MATKVFTHELKVGMFVADLDRPWVDTPFLLQGFLIEDEEQIAALRAHCEYVMVDRARSTGEEYEAAASGPVSSTVGGATPPRAGAAPQPAAAADRSEPREEAATATAPAARPGSAEGYEPRVIHLGTPGGPPIGDDRAGNVGGGQDPGILGRMFSLFRGKAKREAKPAVPPPPQAPPPETPQEFEARAALAPPGVSITTYVDSVSV